MTLKSHTAMARMRWRRRIADDIGLRGPLNSLTRALLDQLWDLTIVMDAERDADKRMGHQRAYVRTVSILRGLRSR